MRILCSSLLVSIVFNGDVLSAAQAGGIEVSTPAARVATIAVAARLVEPQIISHPEAALKDPFYPDLHEPIAKAGPVAEVVSDQERLEQIAAALKPTGSVELGGEPYLLFTEKRQKIGDKLSVSIGEVEFEVEIVSIGKNRFRIRYNNLETTRSIK